MFVVIAYDVVADRQRARLAKRLAQYCHRVQMSVFEGDLDDRALADVMRICHDEIDPASDSVRLYCICQRCRAAVALLGTGRTWPGPDEDEIV